MHPCIVRKHHCTDRKADSAIFCTKKQGYLRVCQATKRVDSIGERMYLQVNLIECQELVDAHWCLLSFSQTVCLCCHEKWKLRYLVPALWDQLVVFNCRGAQRKLLVCSLLRRMRLGKHPY